MGRHGWTAAAAATVFLVMVALIVFVSVPVVAWSPGPTTDLMAQDDSGASITITGAAVYPATGSVFMTTVSQSRADAHVNLLEAVFSTARSHHDVLPRDVIYQDGVSQEDATAQDQALMTSAQQAAIVAGLRAAGIDVTQRPRIAAVRQSGPSFGKLEVNDLIMTIDGQAVETGDQALALIRAKTVGEKVVLGALRNNSLTSLTIPVVGSTQDGSIATIGVTWDTGYSYAPVVHFGIDPNVGGSSAGLAFALTIYDKLTPGDLIAGRSVAVTGTITPDGVVGAIGGIHEKIAGAHKAGATIFLIPASNCRDLAATYADMTVVPVASLADAIAALTALADPGSAALVPHC